MTLQEHQHLMRKLNQEYHKDIKPELLGKQWRERQKKWQETKRPPERSFFIGATHEVIETDLKVVC
ncbi:hypothetical protein E0L10_10370 [Enterococcus durans]|uniref:hypothetical protein n=1 Tax=Enterococcus durans TaxID=53345 RepID=UPI00142F6486|nr:hypothetical protein [Enterococcus durans]NJE64506.1 hypothetical protein [Enterococcus durans]